jgi:hypothetical protein
MASALFPDGRARSFLNFVQCARNWASIAVSIGTPFHSIRAAAAM